MSKTGNEKWNALSTKTNPTTDEERRATYQYNGLANLAVAIVESGIESYRSNGYKIKILTLKEDSKSKKAIEECEEKMKNLILFFKSEKFKRLCTLDADWLIKTLDKQIEQYQPQ